MFNVECPMITTNNSIMEKINYENSDTILCSSEFLQKNNITIKKYYNKKTILSNIFYYKKGWKKCGLDIFYHNTLSSNKTKISGELIEMKICTTQKLENFNLLDFLKC